MARPDAADRPVVLGLVDEIQRRERRELHAAAARAGRPALVEEDVRLRRLVGAAHVHWDAGDLQQRIQARGAARRAGAALLEGWRSPTAPVTGPAP